MLFSPVDSEGSNVCEKSFVSRDPFDFLLHRATTTGNTSGNSGSGSIDNPDGGGDIFAGRALATTVAAEAIYSTPVKKHLRNASLVILPMYLLQMRFQTMHCTIKVCVG